MSSIQDFAHWVDACERGGTRFASMAEAAEKYTARESPLAALYAERVASGAANIVKDQHDKAADLELIQKAIEHPEGEYVMLAYVPGPAESCFVNMGICKGKSGGENLIAVLKWYGLNGHLEEVDRFQRTLITIVNRARFELAALLGHRAKHN